MTIQVMKDFLLFKLVNLFFEELLKIQVWYVNDHSFCKKETDKRRGGMDWGKVRFGA